jgi:hypothetical protein
VDITGKIAYHAGTSGTVTLDAQEKVLSIIALGAAGAYITIDGGDQIALPANYVFNDRNDANCEEFVGSTIVFHSTLSYYVKTKQKV